MIQSKQPKKVKAKRRKEREEIKERLMTKFPTWFEGRTNKEINELISVFKHSGKPDEEFPDICIEYEIYCKEIIAECDRIFNIYERISNS